MSKEREEFQTSSCEEEYEGESNSSDPEEHNQTQGYLNYRSCYSFEHFNFKLWYLLWSCSRGTQSSIDLKKLKASVKNSQIGIRTGATSKQISKFKVKMFKRRKQFNSGEQRPKSELRIARATGAGEADEKLHGKLIGLK